MERPIGPTTQTSLGNHRRQRTEAWNLEQISSETAGSDGLDWDHFRDLYYPESRRHYFPAIVAFGEYKRTARHARSEVAALNDPISAGGQPPDEPDEERGAST
jgi:hypothetical protein